MLYRSERYEHAYTDSWKDSALPDAVWKGEELSRFVAPTPVAEGVADKKSDSKEPVHSPEKAKPPKG
jgi:hypothetical protein